MKAPEDVAPRPPRSGRRPSRVLAAAALTLATCIGTAGHVSAAEPGPECGDVVEGHVVLTADLVCPDSETGLTLAPGATLDLAGHRVVGGGSNPNDGRGIGVVVPGQGSSTVRGGTVEGWQFGIGPSPSRPVGARGVATLDDLEVRNNYAGIWSFGLDRVTPEMRVTDSRIAANRMGVLGTTARLIVVTSSHVTDNETGVESYGRVVVVGSTLARNRNGLVCGSACEVTGSILADNRSAMWVRGGPGVVRDSTFVRNEGGITATWVLTSPLEVVANVLQDNGTAVMLVKARANVADNTFVGNDVALESRPWSDDYFAGSVTGNELRGNGDGILSVLPGTGVERNTAVDNARWGIHAPGAVDLGGNRAWGNGNEPQCVGVVCTTSGSAS